MDFRFYESKITHNTMPGASNGCLEWSGGTYDNERQVWRSQSPKCNKMNVIKCLTNLF